MPPLLFVLYAEIMARDHWILKSTGEDRYMYMYFKRLNCTHASGVHGVR